METAAVIGLGYVGLPLLAALAKSGKYQAKGFDTDTQKISLINEGICPIVDDECEAIIAQKILAVSADPQILNGAQVFFVCVPTPVHGDFSPDLDPLVSAIEQIAPFLTEGALIIIESTINPGVCDEIIIPLITEKTGLAAGSGFGIAHCPERINPGDPQWKIGNIPRNIGANTPEVCRRAAEIYRAILTAEIYEMATLKEAEATKIIENAFRDINIAFVNELAKSFDAMGIDLISVLKGAAKKPFGFLPHFPGCGVGGHCIPVDPYYLINRAMQSGFDHKFLRLAREINNSMPAYTVEILREALNDLAMPLKGSQIGVLGIAYKGNVADKRESPALKIIDLLREKGAVVHVFDPYFPTESTCAGLEALLEASEAVVIATEHDAFRALSPEVFFRYNVRIVIDGKNSLRKELFRGSPLIYRGIGRA